MAGKAAQTPKALVVVESPSKAKTIKKYLGPGYDVRASVGHVKDLPKSKIGVDIEHGFEPCYETIRGKGKILQEIRAAARKADRVYLAPDPDREGEAIAWHIASELKIPREKIKRVLFNEITKRAVRDALEHPCELDENRFNSQQARRILDRLVGYKISPLLWNKVRRGLSAGRVQSVAVRLVVEREQAIRAFQREEYWTVAATLRGARPPSFSAKLHLIGGKKAELKTGDEAHAAVEVARPGPFVVQGVRQRDRRQSPSAPFTTSRLQQDAARAYRFTAKRTMAIAQRLYEGVELGAEGAAGLITYMRTDSPRLSDDAVREARRYIGERYGARYLPAKPQVYKSKGRTQDAHEAIRPTSMAFPPERVKPFLKAQEYKLYSLIWKRFVACQMTPAVYAMTAIDIEAPGEHIFRATGSIQTFDGFSAVYQEQRSEDDLDETPKGTLPVLGEGDRVTLDAIEPTQHFTQPPPRFTEATLVKELEEKGIGRPSTYAAIISTIQDKAYAEKKERRFHPTELGMIVTELLVESFPRLFDVGFTARMEDQLDDVEEGHVAWRDLLSDFWGELSKTLETARTEMRSIKGQETPTDIVCPKDGGAIVIKFGKNGSFLACSNYPECKYSAEFERLGDGTLKIIEDERTGDSCPECKGGELVYRSGRFGHFIACSNYPECRYTQPISTGVVCPECGEGDIIEKVSRRGKVFYSCSTYPKCKHAQWDRPMPMSCPACGNPFLNVRSRRGQRAGGEVVCPACGYEREMVDSAST